MILPWELRQLLGLYLASPGVCGVGGGDVEGSATTNSMLLNAIKWAALTFELHPSIFSEVPGSFLT